MLVGRGIINNRNGTSLCSGSFREPTLDRGAIHDTDRPPAFYAEGLDSLWTRSQVGRSGLIWSPERAVACAPIGTGPLR